MAAKTPTRKAHCNNCKNETNHRVLKTKSNHWADEDAGVFEETIYTMLECCGCNDIALLCSTNFSENEFAVHTYFPPRISRWLPKWETLLPTEIRILLAETYKALQSDSRCLATMGVRAIIERAMIDKVGDQGTFEKNLQELEAQGHATKRDLGYLAAALEVGNAAIHRAYLPSDKEVGTAIDIMEHLLLSLYTLDDATVALRKGIPSRSAVNRAVKKK